MAISLATRWTHVCLCPTWRLYAARRTELSRFYRLGDWTQQLTTSDFQHSEEPYEQYLANNLGINPKYDKGSSSSSWWTTELHGWSGGESHSAQTVDISIRKNYSEGFFPLEDIPPQRRVEEDDIQKANTNLTDNKIQRNMMGFLSVTSWEQYYHLRGIPVSSPCALLCTFPLTIYYAITQYGEVPCTVARILNRPMRLHIVGVEKEANFLDLFQEVGFLLPSDFPVRATLRGVSFEN